jgi:uncharacterized coiled-coil DUF342 family protein
MENQVIIEMAQKYKALRAKFKTLNEKALQAIDAAEMAAEAMSEAQTELLAVSAGIPLDEFMSDTTCPECGNSGEPC